MDSQKLESMSLDELNYTVLVDNPASVLVVDDEDVIRLVFESLFEQSPYQAGFAASGEEALEMFDRGQYCLLIVDKNLPGISGLDVIRHAHEHDPETESIVMTGYASYESAVEALQLGAFDYLEKPFADLDLVKQKIDRAMDKQRLAHENSVLAEHLRAAHHDFQKVSSDLEAEVYSGRHTGVEAQKLTQQLLTIRRSIINAAGSLQEAYGRFQALSANRIIPAEPAQQIETLIERSWYHLTEPLPQLRNKLGQ